jgi:hypothetical protein
MSDFEDWYSEDDHDLYNYPEEAIKAAWDHRQGEIDRLCNALWELSGKAARLEFGDHKHIDRLQAAVYSETLAALLEGEDG